MSNRIRRGSWAAGSALLAGLLSITMATPASAQAAGTQAAGTQADPAPVGSTAQCSAEPLNMAYYRTWRDVTVPPSANSNLPDKNVTRMTDLPPEVDVAMVFDAGATADTDYWPTLRDEYVPTLHARGTRVVRSLGIKKIANADIPLNDDAYRAYAKELVDTLVTPYGLDGLDVDVETYLTGDSLTRAIGVFNALGDLIGPRSGSDRLFLYDTNQNGDTSLFEAVSQNLSFVLLQAYGRGTSGMQATWSTFADDIAPCQFLPGFSFPEEQDRTHWGDAEGLYDPATAPEYTAYEYATWQPEGATKGGIFSYAVDRDGKVWGDDSITPTSFTWTKNLAAVQDDAAGVAPKPTTAELAADRVTISGVGAPGATVSISVRGPGIVPSAASAVAAVDGSWTVRLDRRLTVPQTATVTQRLPHTPSSAPVQVRFRPVD